MVTPLGKSSCAGEQIAMTVSQLRAGSCFQTKKCEWKFRLRFKERLQDGPEPRLVSLRYIVGVAGVGTQNACWADGVVEVRVTIATCIGGYGNRPSSKYFAEVEHLSLSQHGAVEAT